MQLALGFRFQVSLFAHGETSKPLDLRFSRVSGLSAEVKTTSVVEGGQNLYTHRLPERVDYGNLVLERGLVAGRGSLELGLDAVMRQFQFKTADVMVMLLDEVGQPIDSWLFIKAYPVRWSTADLAADDEKIVIDTLELAYAHMMRDRA